jgi:isoleucyl-tRNA synthetase
LNVQAGRPVTVEVEGQGVEIAPEEILVRTHPAEGLTVAADRFTTVALDTTITPELRAEGLARELVRRIQAMRKDAGFNIEDRITTYFQGDGDLAEVMGRWADYIRNETLSTILVEGTPPDGAYTETHRVDGESITLSVQRNPAKES